MHLSEKAFVILREIYFFQRFKNFKEYTLRVFLNLPPFPTTPLSNTLETFREHSSNIFTLAFHSHFDRIELLITRDEIF